MASNVVELDAYRTHVHGNATCLSCGHAWIAVVPEGTIVDLECPECGEDRGDFVTASGDVEERSVIACACGGTRFLALEIRGLLCEECGQEFDPWPEGGP